MNHIKEALKDKNGDAYIWLCVIVVFISMLLSVLILYMGLLSQVQIQKRDMKHKLDGYISDYATVAFNAVKQGEAYEVYDRASETRSNNNAVQAQFEVKKYSELSTSAVTPSADYIEGNDIIASFYVSNDSSTPVLPSDHMSYRLEVYLVDGATETLVSTQDKTDVVIPANGTNLVYFKWRVPENSAGKLYMFRGIANAENTVRDRNPDNNATFFMKTVKAKETSQTPNTRYERTAPSTYNPLVSSPTTTVGSASWNEWVFEDGKFELRAYGIRASSVDPVVKPDDNCKTAVLENGKWSMKSGYGISLAWNFKLIAMSGYSMPDSSAYTEAQMVMALIPEYGYSTDAGKYRSLEMAGGIYSFVENRDADGNARLHFVPVYVANGSYTVSVTATQIWTPAGICYASRDELSEAICNKYHVADDKSNGKDIPDGSFRVEEAMAERHYSSKKAAARHKGLRTNLGQDGGTK